MRKPPALMQRRRLQSAIVGLPLLWKIEQVEQVANGWAVRWNVRACRSRNGIGEVIPAALRNRIEVPVSFDELQERNVIPISMGNVSRNRVRRNCDQRDARAIAEV